MMKCCESLAAKKSDGPLPQQHLMDYLIDLDDESSMNVLTDATGY